MTTFLWMGFNHFNVTEPLPGDGLLFTIKSSGNPGTDLIDLETTKGLVNLGATQSL